MHVGAISPKEIPPDVYPFGPHHNPNLSCSFHAGYIGNTIEDCFVFKNRVQDLINQNILSFTEEKPNWKANPLPNHGNQIVNAMLEEGRIEVVHLVDAVKTLWSSISTGRQKYMMIVRCERLI